MNKTDGWINKVTGLTVKGPEESSGQWKTMKHFEQ